MQGMTADHSSMQFVIPCMELYQYRASLLSPLYYACSEISTNKLQKTILQLSDTALGGYIAYDKPRIQRLDVLGAALGLKQNSRLRMFANGYNTWSARRGSNPQPSESEWNVVFIMLEFFILFCIT